MPVPQRVILLSADHMRADTIGAYGHPHVVTPNLDRLASGGVNFRQCYCQSPLCMPSRASFMTGLYPQQTGVTTLGRDLPGDFSPTLPGLFRDGSFRTVHIGKLHLQSHDNHDQRGDGDESYGFDHMERSEERGCYEDAYVRWLRGEHPEAVECFRTPRPSDPQRAVGEKLGTVVDAPWQLSHSGWVVEVATRYLNGGGLAEPRLLLNLGFHNPHPPLNPTREAFAQYEHAKLPAPLYAESEWQDKPEPMRGMLRDREDWTDAELVEYVRYFYALITEFDFAIGQLLDCLEAADELDNTLIAFTSDHGDMCGDHRITHKNTHFYDEEMRVPLIVHWPAGLGKERRDVSGLVELTDLLPTLLELSGLAVPPVLAGHSLADVLLAGEAGEKIREDVFAFH
ncbi:MAG: sulfatase-like hydrolase/transferase [Verrucomicrobiota bacterium]